MSRSRRSLVAAATAATAATLLVAPALLSAQGRALRTPVGSLTPYAGYFTMGNLINGPLGTALSGSGGPLYGAQLDVPIVDGIGVYGNVAYGTGTLRMGVPFFGGYSFGETATTLYDAGVHLELPGASRSALRPFAQLGAGGLHYAASVRAVRTEATSMALNVGAGVDLRMGNGVGLRLMGKDYVGRVDLREATGVAVTAERAHNIGVSAGVRVSF